ncbi:MAG TPA: TetR/AcrR family transcriptional regulator, partial [Gemmatimonadaceae bacterium]|nr:TetR/AcrR family transcriptional regulator [Gemmatimonadaceae bacterium]
PRWQRRKEARPQEIVAAALELFVRQGFAATRIEDVARAAGVRPGTVYVYFASKEALLEAVVTDAVRPAIGFAERRVADHEGPSAELVRDLVLGWWREFGTTAYWGVNRLIVAEAAHFPRLAEFYVREVMERARALCRAVLARGIARGEFRAVDVDRAVLVLLAPLIWAEIHAFSLQAHDPAFHDVPALLETHLDVFLHGLVATP